MYIDEDPIFQELLEIRKSLFDLIRHRASFRENFKFKEKQKDNVKIRSKIQILRANALYKAGRHRTFEKDLWTLYRRTERQRCLFDIGVAPERFYEVNEALGAHFNSLVGSIRREARWREEEFQLEELSVKPFFKKRDQGSSSDAHVKKEVAGRVKGAQLGEAKLKPILEEGQEDFWNQFVVKEDKQQTIHA